MATKTATKPESGILGKAQSIAVLPDEKTAWEAVALALGQKPCPMVRVAMREFMEKYRRKHRVDISKLPPFLRLSE